MLSSLYDIGSSSLAILAGVPFLSTVTCQVRKVSQLCVERVTDSKFLSLAVSLGVSEYVRELLLYPMYATYSDDTLGVMIVDWSHRMLSFHDIYQELYGKLEDADEHERSVITLHSATAVAYTFAIKWFCALPGLTDSFGNCLMDQTPPFPAEYYASIISLDPTIECRLISPNRLSTYASVLGFMLAYALEGTRQNGLAMIELAGTIDGGQEKACEVISRKRLLLDEKVRGLVDEHMPDVGKQFRQLVKNMEQMNTLMQEMKERMPKKA